MDLLVRGRFLVRRAAEDGVLEDGSVYARNGLIEDVGPYSRLRTKYGAAAVKGNGRQLLMPGLIDAHSHGEGLSTVQRGMTFDFLENGLIDWAFLFEIDPELNAMLSGIRHLRNGCTTMHHNYWGEEPNRIENAEKVIKGYTQSGIRLAYSPGGRNINTVVLDESGFLDTLPADLRRFARDLACRDQWGFVDRYLALFDTLYERYSGDSVRIILGPSWVQGCTPEFLQRVKQRADSLDKTQIHLHTLQTPIQKAFGLRAYGKSLVEHLGDLGLLDSNVTLGHAVFLTEKDIQLLAEYDVSVTHHPSCNLTVRNGIAPVYYLHQAGVNVALGIDDKGINDDDDPISELRMIHKMHRTASYKLDEPPLSGCAVLKMGTVNAARVCGYAGRTGALEPGMMADMILVDLEAICEDPWLSPELPIVEALIHRGCGRHVNTVIVGGRVVVEDRRVLTVDLEDLYTEVRKAAAKGLSPEQRRFAQQLSRLKPYMQSWYSGWTDFESRPFYPVNSRV